MRRPAALWAFQQHARLQAACRLSSSGSAPTTTTQPAHPTRPAECLPHDPLFDLLPALGCTQRGPPKKPHEVSAALAAAAQEAAALGRPGCAGAGLSAESMLVATLLPALGVAPATCCRNKRSADRPAPATAAQPRRPPAAVALQDTPLIGHGATAEATPLQATRVCLAGTGDATADGKRARTLAVPPPPLACLAGVGGAAATPCGVATPGSGVGSNSKVQPKAVRRVARDLSFTPAPVVRAPQPGAHVCGGARVRGVAGTSVDSCLPGHAAPQPRPCPRAPLLLPSPRPAAPAGSPPRTVGSASRCSAVARLAVSPPQPTSVLLQPFSLLRVCAVGVLLPLLCRCCCFRCCLHCCCLAGLGVPQQRPPSHHALPCPLPHRSPCPRRLQSPGTSAQIDALNARIQASAAASIPFERCRVAPAGAAAAPAMRASGVRAARLC